jgi:exodeoxyribonuclease V alpha subunit
MTTEAVTVGEQQQNVDPYDARFALGATGVLRDFNLAGVLSAADVHVAERLGRLGGETDERVLLAVALAVRAVRLGSVCVVLSEARETVSADEHILVADELEWPDADDWIAACAASRLTGTAADDPVGGPGHPLRLVDGYLYLDRYWREEELVRDELDRRAAEPALPVDTAALQQVLARVFTDPPPDRQRLAAAMTALRSLTVLAGGPGTGKTTTVARLLAMLRGLPGETPRVALAAPTGKAAARLQEAVEQAAVQWNIDVGDVVATTIHRLLGYRPGSHSRFGHDRNNRLPFDVVIIDETSMVSLTLMARLLESVRPTARVVLVGDPFQLASVEAGAVLGDLVLRPPVPAAQVPAELSVVVGQDLPADWDADSGADPDPTADPPAGTAAELRNAVVRLTHVHRFGGAIGTLARAIYRGAGDEVMGILRSREPDVEFIDVPDGDSVDATGLRDDVVASASALLAAARSGDADTALGMLDQHRLLCAHRRGPYGVSRWAVEIERWLAAEKDGFDAGRGDWYVGRPLLVTANDYELQLFNGDTGVVVERDGRVLAAFSRGGTPVLLSPYRLAAVETMHAMTVHRAQGSQFAQVSLVLPSTESALLTRELFYTAVTRAQEHVRVLGSEAAVRRAVSRPIVRASGLRRARPERPSPP